MARTEGEAHRLRTPVEGFNRLYDISYRVLKLSCLSAIFRRVCLRIGTDLPQVVRLGV